jgi:hypothetical protein
MTGTAACQRLVTKYQTTQCSNEPPDALPLCWDCIRLLRDTLIGIKEMISELEIQITKQDKGAASVGGTSSDPKLPFDIGSSEALDHVEITLTHWFAEGADREHHWTFQGLTTEQRTRALVEWHLQNYVTMGRRETAPVMLADFDAALARANSAVDRKATKIWIGNCGCRAPVMAYPKQKTMVGCEGCGAEYDPARSRRELRVIGGEQLVTASQAESLGEVWGRTIKRNTVLRWHQRDRLSCRRDDCQKGCTHMFRMSDVLVLHRESP